MTFKKWNLLCAIARRNGIAFLPDGGDVTYDHDRGCYFVHEADGQTVTHGYHPKDLYYLF